MCEAEAVLEGGAVNGSNERLAQWQLVYLEQSIYSVICDEFGHTLKYILKSWLTRARVAHLLVSASDVLLIEREREGNGR